MATAGTQILGQNMGATLSGAMAPAGNPGATASLVTLLGSDGAKLEIKRNGVMIAKSSGGRKITITTTNAKASAGAKAAAGKAAAGKGTMGALTMDKATMAKKVSIVGENGARLEIKRNGLMLAKSPGGREIKIASAKTKPTIMGLGKAGAGQGASVAKGGMTKAAMLKAAAAQAALNPGREANVVAANGAKLELKRNGIIQMKTPDGKEVKIAAGAKGKLAMLGGAGKGQGAIKTVAATKTIAPAAAKSTIPPAPLLAPKHAIIANKGGLVLVNPQLFIPAASKAAVASQGAVAAKTLATTSALGSSAGLGLGLGMVPLGPILLAGAAAVTGFGIYGYVTRGGR